MIIHYILLGLIIAVIGGAVLVGLAYAAVRGVFIPLLDLRDDIRFALKQRR